MRFIIFILFFVACSSRNGPADETDTQSHSNSVEYAKGFELQSVGELKVLRVKNPFQGASESITYYLLPKEIDIPDSLQNENIIRTPIEEIVVTSTSHIPLLDYLDETQALTGFPTLDYISSTAMRARIDSGKIEELGRDNQLNFEVLVQLQPELVMTYMLTGDRGQLKRIEQTGIPVLINADYLEQHPLGRAEWIKIAGALFDKSEQADSVFNMVKENYLTLSDKVKGVTEKPTVLTGIMYGDTWYLPGGANYSANLFKDSGMNYLWKDNDDHGFLELSFETIYDRAKDADLWIGVASYEKLGDLKLSDSRYTWFEAFKAGEVYTYTGKTGVTGGNLYLELGYLRPDIILADLIQVAHPSKIKDREMYFYKKLK